MATPQRPDFSTGTIAKIAPGDGLIAMADRILKQQALDKEAEWTKKLQDRQLKEWNAKDKELAAQEKFRQTIMDPGTKQFEDYTGSGLEATNKILVDAYKNNPDIFKSKEAQKRASAVYENKAAQPQLNRQAYANMIKAEGIKHGIDVKDIAATQELLVPKTEMSFTEKERIKTINDLKKKQFDMISGKSTGNSKYDKLTWNDAGLKAGQLNLSPYGTSILPWSDDAEVSRFMAAAQAAGESPALAFKAAANAVTREKSGDTFNLKSAQALLSEYGKQNDNKVAKGQAIIDQMERNKTFTPTQLANTNAALVMPELFAGTATNTKDVTKNLTPEETSTLTDEEVKAIKPTVSNGNEYSAPKFVHGMENKDLKEYNAYPDGKFASIGYGYNAGKDISKIAADFKAAGIDPKLASTFKNWKEGDASITITDKQAKKLADVAWNTEIEKGRSIGLDMDNMTDDMRNLVGSLLYRGDIKKGGTGKDAYKGELYKKIAEGLDSPEEIVDYIKNTDGIDQVLKNRIKKYETVDATVSEGDNAVITEEAEEVETDRQKRKNTVLTESRTNGEFGTEVKEKALTAPEPWDSKVKKGLDSGQFRMNSIPKEMLTEHIGQLRDYIREYYEDKGRTPIDQTPAAVEKAKAEYEKLTGEKAAKLRQRVINDIIVNMEGIAPGAGAGVFGNVSRVANMKKGFDVGRKAFNKLVKNVATKTDDVITMGGPKNWLTPKEVEGLNYQLSRLINARGAAKPGKKVEVQKLRDILKAHEAAGGRI